MAIDDKLSKEKAYKIIVGQEYSGEVPDFDIRPGSVDNVYLTIKKMQRDYNPLYPGAEYLACSFEKVESAYLAQDRKAFKKAVKELMVNSHAITYGNIDAE